MTLRAPLLAFALFALTAFAAAADAPPPGINVHLVIQDGLGHRFWRGAAPRPDTLAALVCSARTRGVTVTFIDLRTPPNADDRSGKSGRLSPAREAFLAKAEGVRYEPVSALDPTLDARLDAALRHGDVYMHCMYGVNRTGFATARYAECHRLKVDRSGLGPRDWQQGAAFERRHARRP